MPLPINPNAVVARSVVCEKCDTAEMSLCLGESLPETDHSMALTIQTNGNVDGPAHFCLTHTGTGYGVAVPTVDVEALRRIASGMWEEMNEDQRQVWRHSKSSVAVHAATPRAAIRVIVKELPEVLEKNGG